MRFKFETNKIKMSFSANHKIKKNSWNYIDKKYLDQKIHKYINYKRDSSKKEQCKLNIANINNKFNSNTFSNSSINTNISIVKDKEKESNIDKIKYRETNFPYSSYHSHIKPIIEDNLENSFIPKQKIIYKSPSIINNKIISFQKQKNKQILEFSLFDDKLIFKDINRSYLQDEHEDDGSESSDEKIKDGKIFLTQELEDSAKELSKTLTKNKNKKMLSRRVRFKN